VKFQTGELFRLYPCDDAHYPENVEEKYDIAVDCDPVLRPVFQFARKRGDVRRRF